MEEFMDRENTRRMEVFQPVWYKDRGITNERSFRTITAFHIVAKKSCTSLTLNSENMFNAEMRNFMQVQLHIKLYTFRLYNDSTENVFSRNISPIFV